MRRYSSAKISGLVLRDYLENRGEGFKNSPQDWEENFPLWRQKVILFELGTSFLLLESALLRESHLEQIIKVIRDIGEPLKENGFNSNGFAFCMEQLMKWITAWWAEQDSESLCYRLSPTRSGRENQPTVYTFKLPCGHQISFAGTNKHGCQNI